MKEMTNTGEGFGKDVATYGYADEISDTSSRQ
jgi:predicted small secreted protein